MSYTSNSFGTFYSLNKVNKNNPIVFVHGVGLNNAIWKPQINFFKKYNTLTYDLLGHGKTPLKKSKVTFNDFSRQLLSLINELKFRKVHLVGFSLGALIAKHFASKHNDRLCSLIIHGSVYKRTEEQRRVVINSFNVDKLNRPVSKRSALTRWLTEDYISKNPEIYKEIYLMLENNNNKNYLKSYELFTHYNDDDDMIKKIKVNTLITTGEHDVRSTPGMGRKLNKVIKNSRFEEIKKGKHLCSIECADDVNIIFKKFIDDNNV
jgi:pimeloyl-ACP methyl ester carboxylesterase